ncbi:hypothetical protein [Arthrobacter crystallopoietes]|uniref:Uncharacterized protein n=1 Tax=Crystallibacter crystallopoietes TaxID=37928 RepID=A0A1H1B197_9MICC|nr:hypothetical protein [Arthrobacter crystallopoietes]SDQ45551.1 hypothetical protein SAMN04489742_1183 [Arthrobacter crystallopoietes]
MNDKDHTDNIRDEQQTKAGGAVPAGYVGSGDPAADRKPEDALAESTGEQDPLKRNPQD